MTNAALIVAAGRGSRMGAETPKQYLALGGQAVLQHTVRAFLASDRIDTIRVVIHPDDAALYPEKTDYLFYVLDVDRNDGSHNFYETAAGFAQGKAKYQRWLAKQR